MGLRGADTARPPAAWIWWRQGWDPPTRCLSGCCAKSLSRVWLSATPWTGALQAPLSMGFSKQEYWSGLPCSPPGDLPNPGIKPRSLHGRRIFTVWATKPRRLKWVAYPFSRGSSQPRNLYLMDSLPPELPGKPSLPLLGPTRESELLMCLRKKWFCILPGVFVITVGTQLSPTFKILSGS